MWRQGISVIDYVRPMVLGKACSEPVFCSGAEPEKRVARTSLVGFFERDQAIVFVVIASSLPCGILSHFIFATGDGNGREGLGVAQRLHPLLYAQGLCRAPHRGHVPVGPTKDSRRS